MKGMRSILFVSQGDSGRSVIAAGLARQMFGDAVSIKTAGVAPGTLHPAAVTVMLEIHIDVRAHVPRALTQADLEEADLVILVSSRPLNQELPPSTKHMHWPIPDPTDDLPKGGALVERELLQRFRDTRLALSKHLKALSRMIDLG